MIEGLTKDWPVGYYILVRSKAMVPGARLPIDIGETYNTWKVLSFFAIAGTERTMFGIS